MQLKRIVLGLLIIIPIILLSGCVSKTEYSNLELQCQSLQQELSVTQDKLTDLKANYPLHYFESRSTLVRWIKQHKGIGQTTADKDYGEALRIQYEAMLDGYLISASYWDIDESYGTIWLSAVAGDNIYWWFIDEAEIQEEDIYYYDYR